MASDVDLKWMEADIRSFPVRHVARVSWRWLALSGLGAVQAVAADLGYDLTLG